MILFSISRPFRTAPALHLLIDFSPVRRFETPFIATTKKSFQKISKKTASRPIFGEKYNNASSEGFSLTIRWVIWYK